jgi:polysaccharide biosynthesis/export protein
MNKTSIIEHSDSQLCLGTGETLAITNNFNVLRQRQNGMTVADSRPGTVGTRRQAVSKRHLVSFFALALAPALFFWATVGTVRAQTPEPAKKKQSAALNLKDDPAAADASSGADSNAVSPERPAAVQPLSGYHVGPDDELTISVWHEPELSQAVVVRSDGMITLPLLNDIKISGLTTEDAQALLTEKLKAVVNDPQVTVIVKAVKSRKVFLVGNAAKQGEYPLTGSMTVLELLAQAGGLGPFAKTKSIYVLRKEDGKELRLRFDYKKALSGKGNNPELMPGDMVVVP